MIKIDVKKAFDSAAQTSMGHLVTEHIGKRGQPFLARHPDGHSIRGHQRQAQPN